MRIASALIVTLVISAGAAMAGPPLLAGSREDPLDAARTLYMSAAYEEALAALTGLPAGVDVDQADKFRALCQLALNRTQDAQQTLEQLATRRPMLKLDESEAPKLIAMFRDARARVLPAAAKTMYAEAKGSFEKGDFSAARRQFGDLMSVLSEKELAGQAAFSDMKLVAEGFLKLADQQLAVQRAGAAASTSQPVPTSQLAPPTQPAPSQPSPTGQPPSKGQPSASTQASEPAPAHADAPRIYTIADQEVVPPVAIDQTIPPWTPPLGNLRYQEFSGLLEVFVDETGAVTSVAIVQHLNVVYDQLLTNAAKRWRYRPAMRNGQPVKYRKQLNIVLRPVSPGTGSGG
jgi:protein TonB